MYEWIFIGFLTLSGTAIAGSVKIVRQGDEALVETLGKYEGKKLKPGLTFITPFIEQVAYKETLREQMLEIPHKQCTTRDKVAVTVDVVVYWRVMDTEKAYYKVQNLKGAMLNLLLTQIRTEIAKMKLEETFTARNQINEALVRELDVATEPWGVKVTRVELRDIGISSNVLR
jgi:regulator of protease activity HflC (stomatin/prohibitin superfamily)